MRVQVDDRFLRELRTFRLRYTCDHCLHYLPEENACAHGWPNQDHRKIAEATTGEVVFCKEFEIL